MQDLLSQLTIVVPTNTRHEHLARLLAYYADLPVTLVIMDGTKEAFDITPYAGKAFRLRYQHMPKPIIERLRHAGGLVDTPYVMLSCDDEYYLFDGLRKCILTLAGDPALAAVNGRCAAFVTKESGMILGLYYDFLRAFHGRSALASERLRQVANVPPITSGFYYSMMRTEAWHGSVSQAFRRPYGSPYVQEMLFSTCLFIQGQVETINDVVWLRNLDNPPVTHANWNRKKTLAEWTMDPATQDEVMDMLQSLAAFYQPYAVPGQDSFGLPDFINAFLAFDQKASAGLIKEDEAIPFNTPMFRHLCAQRGIPVDAAALQRAEGIELDAQIANSKLLQARIAATLW